MSAWWTLNFPEPFPGVCIGMLIVPGSRWFVGVSRPSYPDAGVVVEIARPITVFSQINSGGSWPPNL
jgi:hypothetical protein